MGKWVRASARFCPSVSAGTVRCGRRHLAVDIHALCLPQTQASGKLKNSDLAVCGKISIHITWVLKCYFADGLFFDSCITVFEPCDSVTANWSAFKTHINAEEKSRLVCAEASNSHPILIRN